MKANTVNAPNTGDLEDPISNLLCAIRVGSMFAEQVLNSAASGNPFDPCDANAAVWALKHITDAAEALDADFQEVLDAYYADRRAQA